MTPRLAERSALGCGTVAGTESPLLLLLSRAQFRLVLDQHHSLSWGSVFVADILAGIQIFKTVEAGAPRLAGSIPVRLRYQPKRRCGATADGRGSREGPEVLTKF